jgi:soluble lytic murein transglycosylase-like protein
MRIVLSVVAALALVSPALAIDAEREPNLPVALHAKQPVRGARVVRAAPPVAPAPTLFGFFPLGFAAAPAAEPRGSAERAHRWDASMDAAIARHAAANGVPMELARRVVMRESGGNPRAVSKGNYGLMQIRLGTAHAMGYRGNAQGLLDADTNMTYAMRYLAGALRAARGNHDRAIQLYARGYYYEAKAQGFSPYAPPREAAIMPLGLATN